MGDLRDEQRSAPKINLFGRDMGLPRARAPRIALGVALVLMGTVGFLPVVGFWMIPLGLFVLATDFPSVRRFNRRSGVWIRRKLQRKRP